MRPPVDWDHPRVVNRLHVEHHVGGRLHDLIDAAVGSLKPRHAKRDAALAQPAAVRAIGGMQLSSFGQGGPSLLRLGCLRRDPAVRRIDDERRPPFEAARRQPERIVVAGFGVVRLGGGVPEQRVGDQLVAEEGVAIQLELPSRLLQLFDFRVGERCLVRPGRRTL